MLRRMQDERPEKFDDQGLAPISETLKSRPVGCDFTIKKRWSDEWQLYSACGPTFVRN